MWHLDHFHDYFIAGLITGIVFSAWIGMLVALFIETRKSRNAKI